MRHTASMPLPEPRRAVPWIQSLSWKLSALILCVFLAFTTVVVATVHQARSADMEARLRDTVSFEVESLARQASEFHPQELLRRRSALRFHTVVADSQGVELSRSTEPSTPGRPQDFMGAGRRGFPGRGGRRNRQRRMARQDRDGPRGKWGKRGNRSRRGGPRERKHGDRVPPPWTPGMLAMAAEKLASGEDTWEAAGGLAPILFARAPTEDGYLMVGTALRFPPSPWPFLGRIAAGLSMMALAAALAGILGVRFLTRRLRELERGVQRLRHGDLSVRLEPGSRDEIGALIEDFNAMAGSLESAHAELEDQDQARREMLADVSHELRTPLTGMLCQLELLAEAEGALDEEARARLNTALTEGRAVSARVSDLLTVARADLDQLPLSPLPTNLQRFLSQLTETLAPTLKSRNVTLQTDFVEEIVEVTIDPERIGQVVRNLVANAAQAMIDRGTVVLRVRPERYEVLLEVEDDGPGIPLAEQPTIFDRFRRGEGRRGAGTGLGLAIARQLVERHQGRLELDSEPGKGSRFRIFLPREARS